MAVKGEMLSQMLLLATTSHDGQFDKGGNPYILHPLKVMHYLQTDDEELMCIALGHDLIEDTMVGEHTLKLKGMSHRVIEGIKCLTKTPDEPINAYIRRIKLNQDAIRVKMCDLRHNSDIRRLKGITEKDFKRMETYHRLYLELKDALA